MKMKEELNVLKGDIEAMSKKLHELTAEELELVRGGNDPYTTDLFDIFDLLLRTKKDLKEAAEAEKGKD